MLYKNDVRLLVIWIAFDAKRHRGFFKSYSCHLYQNGSEEQKRLKDAIAEALTKEKEQRLDGKW